MAYSSIGHMGFALVGLAAGTPEGVQGVLVYMAIYVAMTLGTFAVHPGHAPRRHAGREHQRSRRASRARIRPWRSSSAMLLFSLAGIPPLAGFFAKFYVFLAAIKAGLYHARGDRRAHQRRGRLLLSDDRQDHVFRRAGAGFQRMPGAVAAGARRSRA